MNSNQSNNSEENLNSNNIWQKIAIEESKLILEMTSGNTIILQITKSDASMPNNKCPYYFSTLSWGHKMIFPVNPGASTLIDLTVKQEKLDDLRKRIKAGVEIGYDILKKFGIYLNNQIPPEVRRFISDTNPEILLIITNDPDLPWELVFDHEEFWCIKYAMGRILSTYRMLNSYEISPEETKLIAQTKFSDISTLFIADPTEDLPETLVECEKIRKKMQTIDGVKNLKDLSQKSANITRVYDELNSGLYDIIHIASHASFKEIAPSIILYKKKPLTSEEISHFDWKFRKYDDIIKRRPIIFSNCCESARDMYKGEKLEGLATAFIQAGAMACIGTLWKVFEESASNFATTFYERLLKRERIGNALTYARRAIKEMYSKNTYWAPYILYGNPLQMLHIASPPEGISRILIIMSDKTGTLGKVLPTLSSMGINLRDTHSFTIIPRKKAGYIAEIDWPENKNFNDVKVQIKEKIGNAIDDLYLLSP